MTEIITKTRQRINAVYCNRGVYLSVYLYLIYPYIWFLFVCVKDRACLRIARPAYCFKIFGSILEI